MRRAESYIARIKCALTSDLLKPAYKWMHDPANPTAGHCYHAAEALWHLLGGRDSPWKPMRVREADGMTHWWLQHRETSEIADPTADQYRRVGEEPPYAQGKGGGFMTAQPSKPAAEIIHRVRKSDNRVVFLDSPLGVC